MGRSSSYGIIRQVIDSGNAVLQKKTCISLAVRLSHHCQQIIALKFMNGQVVNHTPSLNLLMFHRKCQGRILWAPFIQVYVLSIHDLGRQNVLGNKFSVHERSDCEHCEMFSVPLLSDFKSAHISVCAVWLIVYTLRNVWGHFNGHSPLLIAVCVLSPAHFIEPVLGFTSFRLRFGGVLRGRFVPRTWFDRVPAGTVLAGTWLFKTRLDYKIWCVSRTCSRCTPVPKTSVNAQF